MPFKNNNIAYLIKITQMQQNCVLSFGNYVIFIANYGNDRKILLSNKEVEIYYILNDGDVFD